MQKTEVTIPNSNTYASGGKRKHRGSGTPFIMQVWGVESNKFNNQTFSRDSWLQNASQLPQNEKEKKKKKKKRRTKRIKTYIFF